MPGGRDWGQERFTGRPQERDGGGLAHSSANPRFTGSRPSSLPPTGPPGPFSLSSWPWDNSSHREEAECHVSLWVRVCLCVLEYVCDLCVFLVGLSMFVYFCVCMHSSFYLWLHLSNMYQYPLIFQTNFLANLSFSNQGLNLCPLRWKRKVLTNGQPRKSLYPFQTIAYWEFATRSTFPSSKEHPEASSFLPSPLLTLAQILKVVSGYIWG